MCRIVNVTPSLCPTTTHPLTHPLVHHTHIIFVRARTNTEIKVEPVALTTTPVPYVYTTVKPPRRKHNQNHKQGHDAGRTNKDTTPPKPIHENEIVGGSDTVEGEI